MRRVRYSCAMSLDGYIAGPQDEYDWIAGDPDFDGEALFAQFDTYLLGRRTYEVTGAPDAPPGSRIFVFSQTLRQEDCDGVTIVGDDWRGTVEALRREQGKDIWLFGGGSLFRTLCEAGMVDTVEVAVLPTLLGGGVPLAATLSRHVHLALTAHRVYEKTGMVVLTYDIVKPRGG